MTATTLLTRQEGIEVLIELGLEKEIVEHFAYGELYAGIRRPAIEGMAEKDLSGEDLDKAQEIIKKMSIRHL